MESTDGRWACAFTAQGGCTHKALFKHEYQRTNRVNRTKIVRCFPHCCPRHKPRSYCGSTLLLSVTIPPQASLAHVDALQVFARFRTDQSDAVGAGTRFPRNIIRDSLQSSQHPTAEWVTSRVVSRAGSTWIFEINPQARWLYAWDSGATKAQRLTRHLLEAVVDAPQPRQPDVLLALATARSPTFTFVSFRRAADSDVAEPDQSLLFRALTWELQQRALGSHEPSLEAVAVHPLKRPLVELLRDRPTPSLTPAKKKLCLRNVRPPQSFVETLGFVLTSVTHLPATRLAMTIPALEADLYRLVVGAHRSDRPPPPIDRSDAVSVAARLVWWLHTDPQLRGEAHVHATRAVRSLGDAVALKHAYERWIVGVQHRSETFLSLLTWNWNALDRALVMLDTPAPPRNARHAFDFQSFVATVRQLAIGAVQRPERFQWTDARVWMCSLGDVLSVRRSGIKSGSLDVFSVGSLLAFWLQISALRMIMATRMDSSHGSLVVHSVVQSPSPGHGHWPRMRLVLDRRHRCFATLPRGEPSLSAMASSNHSVGEYIGSVAYSEVGSPILHVTFYAWPRDRSGCAYRFLCTIATRHGTLWLAVRVGKGDVRPRGDDTPLETLSLAKKLALVDEWTNEYELRMPFRPAL